MFVYMCLYMYVSDRLLFPSTKWLCNNQGNKSFAIYLLSLENLALYSIHTDIIYPYLF